LPALKRSNWSYYHNGYSDDLFLIWRRRVKGAALVHVYTDGSVLVTHGGTELGQGLHTKIVQVCFRLVKLSRIGLLKQQNKFESKE